MKSWRTFHRAHHIASVTSPTGLIDCSVGSILFLRAVFFVLLLVHGGVDLGYAKAYLDVTSPGASRLPIAIQTFTGSKEVSNIVAEDLTFTGLFRPIEDAAQPERPDEPFNPANWRGLGIELVVKGRVQAPFTVVVSAYDVSEGKEVLRKEYAGSKDLLRPVSHSIANDIYKLLTGQQGVFRSRIAYVNDKDARKSFWIMDWDGYRQHDTGITGGILLTPRWSSDAGTILYSAERRRDWGIFLYDLGSGKERNLVMLRGLNMAGNFFPGNREFVFTSSKEGKSEIYVGDAATMTGRKIISSPWIDVSPSISNDGSQIAFVSDRSGTPQIYVSDRNGNGVRRITFEGTYNTAPAWSPKGDRIAFVSRMGGRHQIVVIKPDGSGLAVLTGKGNNEEPTFSPDGRYIAFTSDRDGPKGIYLMRIDGEGQKRISPRGVKATSPSWSPL
ncbi:MAG: Tol-Pal system beta propeller repeat protein TolB [Chloroflexota bacterium]